MKVLDAKLAAMAHEDDSKWGDEEVSAAGVSAFYHDDSSSRIVAIIGSLTLLLFCPMVFVPQDQDNLRLLVPNPRNHETVPTDYVEVDITKSKPTTIKSSGTLNSRGASPVPTSAGRI